MPTYVCNNCSKEFCASPSRKAKFCSPVCSNIGSRIVPDMVYIEKYSIPEPNSGCWLWLGSTDRLGYGYFTERETGRTIGAHRAAWIAENKIELGALIIRHNCDNPGCVNPDHLKTGTHQDNSNDAKARHRLKVGEAVNGAVVTTKQVFDIRNAYQAGESFSAIGRRFGISRNTVKQIALGITWRHLLPAGCTPAATDAAGVAWDGITERRREWC